MFDDRYLTKKGFKLVYVRFKGLLDASGRIWGGPFSTTEHTPSLLPALPLGKEMCQERSFHNLNQYRSGNCLYISPLKLGTGGGLKTQILTQIHRAQSSTADSGAEAKDCLFGNQNSV